MSDRGSEPGHSSPQDSLAELDEWAELAGAGDRAVAGSNPPCDGDADCMSYEELCQAHIEAFIQVSWHCMCSADVACAHTCLLGWTQLDRRCCFQSAEL